jgi:hypothetical protein
MTEYGENGVCPEDLIVDEWDNCEILFRELSLDGSTFYPCLYDLGPGTYTVTVRVADAAEPPNFGTCESEVTVIGSSFVTSSELCTFDRFPELDGQQFRLIYHMDPASPGTYVLTAGNPGQFYYNVFHGGNPGTPYELTMTIPFPFVTQGAQPVHVYADYDILVSEGVACIFPDYEQGVGADVATGGGTESPSGMETIVLDDYVGVGSSTTVMVSGLIPDTGKLLVTIHLDYGLKKSPGWVRSYESDDAVGAPGTDVAGITLTNPLAYDFSFTDGSLATDTTWVESINTYKKIVGFGGVVEDEFGNAAAGVEIVIRNSGGTNIIPTSLQPLLTDADGCYLLTYKHKGKRSTYNVKAGATGEYIATTILPEGETLPDGSGDVSIKANSFGLVNFEAPPAP